MSRLIRSILSILLGLILFGFVLTKGGLINRVPLLIGLVAIGLVGFLTYGYQVYGLTGQFGTLAVVYGFSGLVLIGVILRINTGGFSDPGRGAKLLLIGLLLLFFIAVAPRQRRYLKRTGIFLCAYLLVWFVYFRYGSNLSVAGSPANAAYFMAATFMFALFLFIIPRYVSRNAFLWCVSLLSAVLVVLGLQAYTNPFTIFGLSVQNTEFVFTPMFSDESVHALTSVFGNPNSMGVVGFAGTIAGALLAGEYFPRSRSESQESDSLATDGGTDATTTLPTWLGVVLSFVAGVLFVLNGFGTFLTNSRASFLAVGVSLALYLAYLLFGRRVLPFAVVGLLGTILASVFVLPMIGITLSGRLALWEAGLKAFGDGNTLFGRPWYWGESQGVSAMIEPYLSSHAGKSIHNSYLEILLETGVVGLGGYLVLVIGPLFRGVVQRATVDVPSLVLALGFGANQLFESYTLFHNNILSALAALSVGYIIMNGAWMDTAEAPTEGRSRSRSKSRRDRSSPRLGSASDSSDSWSRPEWGE